VGRILAHFLFSGNECGHRHDYIQFSYVNSYVSSIILGEKVEEKWIQIH